MNDLCSMSRLSFKSYALATVLLFACMACNTTKKLPKGEELYTGAVIHIHSEKDLNKLPIRKELEKVIRPKPNGTFLGLRLKLWIYTITGKDKPKGLRHWIKTKAGEPPVLLSDVHPEKTMELMKNRLTVNGYFHSEASYELQKGKNRKTKLIYTLTLSNPYLIHTVKFPPESDSLSTRIRDLQAGSLIKEGVQYNLDLFKEERQRIEKELKNEGYFYFNADYLLFKADSVKNNKLVNVTLSVKHDIPPKALDAYRLNRIYIIPAPVAPEDSLPVKADTVRIKGYYFLNSDSSFRPEALLNGVYLKTGDLYSRRSHSETLNHMMERGTFKFVEIKFVESADSVGKLDVYIRLSPLPRRSFQADLEAITKSNNFSGPALTLSFKNRNLWGGAELFVFNLLGSFETQLGGTQSGYNSYELGANTQLFLPGFVTPFHLKHLPTLFLPKTKFEIGFRELQRVSYYSMAAMNGSYGFKWKTTPQQEHELDPVSLSFTKLLSTTDAFRLLLQNNPYLKKSFQEQFIIGSAYAYTYNTQVGSVRRSQYYFNGSIQLSGNTLYLAQSLLSNRRATDEDPYKIFGYAYSQYSRFTLEGRYYYNVTKKSKIAARLYGGLGLPSGNSSTMPYVKQFFSGGANSLRAFQARSMGPGSYHIPDSLAGKAFLDQSGDIKLEGNLEYRFTIIGVLKGAFFADVGNVWLSRKSAQYPGGEFNSSEFEKQIAVGSGAGLRLDLSFFVLRLDLAFPLRIPSFPENERWVVRQVNFSDPSWRSHNLILNIAIGYPF
jgi:outer membrane protein insertion porin family